MHDDGVEQVGFFKGLVLISQLFVRESSHEDKAGGGHGRPGVHNEESDVTDPGGAGVSGKWVSSALLCCPQTPPCSRMHHIPKPPPLALSSRVWPKLSFGSPSEQATPLPETLQGYSHFLWEKYPSPYCGPKA